MAEATPGRRREATQGQQRTGTVRSAAARLLHHGAYTDRVGRALLNAVAELCQLAGWVTVDAGAPQRAVSYLALGVHAAHAAGDRPTAANLVSTLAYQVANLDDPHEAVLLASSATAGARGTPAPPPVHCSKSESPGRTRAPATSGTPNGAVRRGHRRRSAPGGRQPGVGVLA